MGKDRENGENGRVKSHRNLNLLSHYHEYATGVFDNGHGANEYLHNLFIKAAKNGEEQRIQNFLVRSSKNCIVNLNYKDKNTGNTAVLFAASRNHVRVVKMLLNYGADITLLNNQGQSVFDVATDSIIPLLLASVERKGVSNRHLLQAAWQGNLQILQRLLSTQAGLDVNCKNADGMTPLLLVTRDVNLFEKIERNVSEKGYNPFEVVKELLQHNADCSITASDGKSPLHYIAHNKGTCAENMANLIIEDSNSQLELPDKSSSLPIHLASRHDNRPVLLALINGGANVNARGHLGQTPLHVAAAQGHECSSSTLLENGADVRIVDDHGNSPVDVSKGRKVMMALKEAWMEQTRNYSLCKKRSNSAPTEFLTEKELRLAENVANVESVPDNIALPLIAEKQTSPRKISAETSNGSSTFSVVKQSNDSQVLNPPKSGAKYVKRSHSMSKVMGDNKAPIKPRLPKTDPNYSIRSKYKSRTRKTGSCSANAGLECSRQMTELPKLSIKNIELQVSSRSEVPLQLSKNHYASIQRFRLLNNPSTLTRTSTRDHQGCSSRTSDYSSSQGTERIKLPKTLAPLSNEGRRSPDTRQVCSRSSLGSGHGFIGDVLDLDNLQSTSSCSSSLQQMVGFNSEIKDIVVLPTSPCEDSVLKPPPSHCGDEEMKILPSSNGYMELEYKTIKEVDSEESCIIYNNGGNNTENITTNELISTEIKEGCNDCVQTDDCHGNGCYKTQTFSSTNLSNFWIPYLKNGETCLGITDNSKKDNNELDNTNQKNTETTKKIDNEIKGTEVVDETRRDKNRKDSSFFFYVEFGDSNLNDTVNCPTCGKSKDNGKSNECKECTNGVSQKKTFWISLDGETSDGETDASSATKKCIDRNVDSFKGERYSRRTKSLPENKVALDVKLAIASQNITSDVEYDEHVLKEKYLTVRTEDTIKIQAKSSEGLKNKTLENVEKENEDLNSSLKAYSEDTFIIEKNADEKSLSKICLNQVSSATKVKECNNEPNMDIEVDTQQEQQTCNELKSSIILQSVTMDNDEQHGEKCEENSFTEGTNLNGAEKVSLPSGRECVVSQSDSSRKPIELGDNDAPVLPKSAWSSDVPQEDKPFAIQICNAFPSPVPPINAKPEVQPPIGCNGGNPKPRKNISTKPKRKISTKESKKDGKKNIVKEQPSSGKKRKSGKKGKWKKAKETFKEITVNQSLGCSGYSGLPSRGPCELKENMPSPDLDKVPTLSIDSRATTKLLRGKFPTLSPILESPRSPLLSPATEEVEACSLESFLNIQEPLERSQEFIDELGNLRPEERREGVIVEKVATGDDDDVSHGNFATVNSTGKDVKFCDEDVDEVDGGVFSRLFGTCMPHLKIVASDSDFEAQAIRDDSNDDDNDNDDDHANVDTTCRYEQLGLPVDETDQDIENMLQNILDNDDHDKKGETAQQGFLNKHLFDSHKLPDQKTSVVTSDCNVLPSTSDDSRRYDDNELENNDHDKKEESTQQVLLNKHLVDSHSLPEQETNGVSNDSNVLSGKPEESDPLNGECELRKQGNENKELKETWTRNHVDQISNFLPGEFYSSDDVFIHQGNNDEGCLGGPQDEEEVTSDNDSSYISCESTSRAFSECSTTESCDSYFSSYDSFHGMTLSSHGNTTVESVDINRHEQLHNPQTSNTSSNSSITITPCNSNSSEISVSSNFSSNSRGEVRSHVCSETASLSSNTSCGGDIQWQKGSILGKGGFGTVWLGLVNTGELIAVKQVELNSKDENEAEKQYKKLQEEVSLLKSLRHHNIVKYIGTCLDDNFTINIFMEFVPGGSIAQALKRFGAFVEPVFQRYTKQILSGVEYLHGKNVVHRDIKGGNIMLMRNGVIKLIDFGCAKRLCMNLSLSRNSIMHSMKGTPYWMAPEVIKESSGQGTKSDIWSIGCTVYEMATGNPPWSHMPPVPAMFAIGNGSNVPQLDNTFSKAAREFIAACMTREPSVRPSASDLLHHAFTTQ